MVRDVHLVLLAGRIRRARESVSAVAAELVELGHQDLMVELTNVELQLEEIRGQLIQPLLQFAAAAPRPRRPECPEQLPF
jgi:hypothetical protein